MGRGDALLELNEDIHAELSGSQRPHLIPLSLMPWYTTYTSRDYFPTEVKIGR